MFWKLVFTRQYTWLDSPRIAGLVLPWFQLQASSLHRWSLALWDPYQWCGHPLAAEGQSGTLYPLNWLLWAMPLHRTWLRHVYLNWYFVLIHFQAALFAYWLCRDQRRSRAAAILGGTVFAFGPFLAANAWPAALNAAVWAPLQLLFFVRANRGERPMLSAALYGAALGASWLSGSDEIPITLSIAFAALWIWHGVKMSSWAQPAIAAATAVGIGAMQILPGLEYLRYAPHITAVRAGTEWQANALAPLNLVSFVMPGAGDSALFIGWTALALAAVGAWRYSEQPLTRICLALGMAGLAIAVGPYAMFSGALYGLRLIWKDPHSSLCLLALALPVLASAGLDAVREGVCCPAVTRVLLGAAGLSVLAIFLLSMAAGDDLERLTPIALCGLSAFAAYALLESRARGAISSNATAVLAILLAMWQFGHVAGTGWRNIEFGWPSLKKLADSADLAPVARSQRPARIANPDGSSGLQLGDWLGIEQFDGLTGGTENVVSASQHATARALGGAAFVIAERPQGQLAFQSLSGVKAYAEGKVFPRAWVVTHVDGLFNPAEAGRRLDGPLKNFSDLAFVTGAPPRTAGCGKAGNAAPIAQEHTRLRFRAALPCSGLVVIGQTYYPGWKAFVDGKPARLYEADGFLDGVPAPAGRHIVELVYRPWAVWAGAAISAAAALLLLIAYRRPSAQP